MSFDLISTPFQILPLVAGVSAMAMQVSARDRRTTIIVRSAWSVAANTTRPDPTVVNVIRFTTTVHGEEQRQPMPTNACPATVTVCPIAATLMRNCFGELVTEVTALIVERTHLDQTVKDARSSSTDGRIQTDADPAIAILLVQGSCSVMRAANVTVSLASPVTNVTDVKQITLTLALLDADHASASLQEVRIIDQTAYLKQEIADARRM